MGGRVLVTGGAGYIGSHVCKQLAAKGYTPVCVDSLEHGYTWAVRWGPLETLDVRDEASLDGVFNRYQPVAVMHFAAFIQVGESVTDPCAWANCSRAISWTSRPVCWRQGRPLGPLTAC
jgi:UDP-arabinose 4-epimerase